MRGYDLVGVFDVSVGGNRHGLRHLEDLIGMRDVPAFRPVRSGRSSFRVSGGRACFRPSQDCGDLLRGQRRVVGEVSDGGVGEPGRHHFALYGGGDCWGKWLGLLVGYKRHGRYFAGAVTALAVVLEDGEDVLVKSWRWI